MQESGNSHRLCLYYHLGKTLLPDYKRCPSSVWALGSHKTLYALSYCVKAICSPILSQSPESQSSGEQGKSQNVVLVFHEFSVALNASGHGQFVVSPIVTRRGVP